MRGPCRLIELFFVFSFFRFRALSFGLHLLSRLSCNVCFGNTTNAVGKMFHNWIDNVGVCAGLGELGHAMCWEVC